MSQSRNSCLTNILNTMPASSSTCLGVTAQFPCLGAAITPRTEDPAGEATAKPELEALFASTFTSLTSIFFDKLEMSTCAVRATCV